MSALPRLHRLRLAAGLARRARAFTLIELTVSSVILVILMAAVASAIVLASRAIPDPSTGATPAADVHDAAALLSNDLQYALSATFDAAPTVGLTVTLPPRGADPNTVTVHYYWSGTPGDPLRRVFKGADAVLLPNCQSFSLAYDKLRVDTQQTVSTTATTAEQTLASFSTYSGGTTSTKNWAITSTGTGTTGGWASQYFVPGGIIPAGATAVTVTKVQLNVDNSSGGGSNFTVGIYPAQSGSYAPQSTPLGTQATLNSGTLSTSYAATNFTFSGATASTATQPLCIVVKGTSTTAYGQLKYFTNNTAAHDNFAMMGSGDSGTTWVYPAGALDKQDIPFTVWGTYTYPSTAQQTVSTYYLRSVAVALAAGPNANSASRAETTVQVLNQPQVTGP